MITANPVAAVPIRKRDGFDRLMYASLKDGIFLIPAWSSISTTSFSISALEAAVLVFTRIMADGENVFQPPWAKKYCSETIPAYKDLPVPEAAVSRYPQIENSVSSCVPGIAIEMLSPIPASNFR